MSTLFVTIGLENEREGGFRCFKCYELRLRKTAELATNFDYFTTTLTVSPYKNSNKINEIGLKLQEEYGIKYLVSDFKKKEGYKKSIEFKCCIHIQLKLTKEVLLCR